MNYLPHKAHNTPFPDPDARLLTQVRTALEGDLRAFEELVLRYQGRVVANCRYITRDKNNAEDLAQEVMVKMFFGLRSFEGRSSFSGWLKQIKVNHCIDYLRKQTNLSFVGIDEYEVHEFDQLKDFNTASSLADIVSNRKMIGAVLDSMPSALRIPLLLCDMDQMSYEEVAGSIGVSLSAAKMRIKRARELFRERYQAVQSAKAASGHNEQ